MAIPIIPPVERPLPLCGITVELVASVSVSVVDWRRRFSYNERKCFFDIFFVKIDLAGELMVILTSNKRKMLRD